VRPGSTVELFHNLDPGTTLSPWLSLQTGDYSYITTVPHTVNNGQAVMVEAKVRGLQNEALTENGSTQTLEICLLEYIILGTNRNISGKR
jgi:hypothetical protein